MKKTQWTDAIRNIRNQWASFLSIAMIALLAANAYLAIAYTAKALNRNVTDYYDAHNAQDFSVYSPLLLTGDDLEAIRGLDGVTDAEGAVETSAWVKSDAFGATRITVLSVPERISIPVLQEGRMPENRHEAAVEVKLMESQGLSVGDTIALGDKSGGTPLLMQETEFTVTGVFYHPDHINKDFIIPPYVIVAEEAFDGKLLQGGYPRARVRMADTPDDRFTEAYWNQSDTVEAALKELSLERTPQRGSEVWNRYLQEIEDGEHQLEEAKTALEDADRQLSEGEAQIRDYDEQLQEGSRQIEEAEQQLLDADEQIAEAEQKLADAEAEHADDIQRLEDAREELRKAAEKLGIAPDQLDAAEAQLHDALVQLEIGKDQLDAGKAQLDEGKAQIEQFISAVKSLLPPYDAETVEKAKAAIKEDIQKRFPDISSEQIDAIFNQIPVSIGEDAVAWAEGKGRAWLYEYLGINAGQAEYDRGLKEYQDGLRAYEEGRNNYYYMGEEYLDGLLYYEKGMKEVAEAELQLKELYAAREELEAKKQELEDARKELEEKRQELADGQQKLEEAKAELEANRKLYAEKLAEYESYHEQISEARNLLGSMENGVWTVLNAHADQGYIFNESNSENLASMSLSFSMVFIVVAALVIYSGVGRMVDEQSKLVGVNKALGLYNREILNKYIIFGLSATVVGLLLGILVACFGLQNIVLQIYSAYYHLALTKRAFLPLETLLVIAGGILITVIAVRIATSRLLRSTAITLMNGAGPASTRLTGKSGGSLYSRLIRLNMLSDMKRVVVTIVSVIGCCTLLMVGFGVKFAVNRVAAKHFGEVAVYEAELGFDAENPTLEGELSDYLEDQGVDYVPVYQNDLMLMTGDTLSAGKIICADADRIEGFYNLRDVKGKNKLTIPEHGVLIPKRMAESFGIQKGDILTLFNDQMNSYQAEVSDVYNNYFLHVVVLSAAAYEEVFGSAPHRNTMYLNLNGVDFSEFFDAVRAIDGVLTVEQDVGRMQLESGADSMNAVVVLMIVIASLMALFIQVNLTESYMIHKKKELTVMRINGFSVKECVRYASLEMIVTTVLGILLGVPIGAGFAYLIIRSSEADYMQFVRSVDPRSIVFSILITALFSLLINGVALRKIRKLNLSDV